MSWRKMTTEEKVISLMQYLQVYFDNLADCEIEDGRDHPNMEMVLKQEVDELLRELEEKKS